MDAFPIVGDLRVRVLVTAPHERMEGAHDYATAIDFPAVGAAALLWTQHPGMFKHAATLAVMAGLHPNPAGGQIGVIVFQMPAPPEVS